MALLGLRLGLPTPHTLLLFPAGRLRQPAHPLLSVPGVLVATTPASVDPVDLVAGRAATVSVPSAQAVPATAGVLGLPGLRATGLQALGPAGGAAAHAPAAPGQAGLATAPRHLGLPGVDVRLAPPPLPLSPPLSPLDRQPAFRPAQLRYSCRRCLYGCFCDHFRRCLWKRGCWCQAHCYGRLCSCRCRCSRRCPSPLGRTPHDHRAFLAFNRRMSLHPFASPPANQIAFLARNNWDARDSALELVSMGYDI